MIKKVFKKITEKVMHKPPQTIEFDDETIRKEFMSPAEIDRLIQEKRRMEARMPKPIPILDPKWEYELKSKMSPLTVEEDLYLKLRKHVTHAVTFQNEYFIKLLLEYGYADFNEQENNNPRAYTRARKLIVNFYEYEPIFALDLRAGLMNSYPFFEKVYFESVPPDSDKVYAIVFKLNNTEGHLHSEGFKWFEKLHNTEHLSDRDMQYMKYMSIEELNNVFSRDDVILLRDRIAKEDLVEIYAIHPGEYYFERLR